MQKDCNCQAIAKRPESRTTREYKIENWDGCRDIQEILRIPGSEVFRSSINRPNLHYLVRWKPPKNEEVLAFPHTLQQDLERGVYGRADRIWLSVADQKVASSKNKMFCKSFSEAGSAHPA